MLVVNAVPPPAPVLAFSVKETLVPAGDVMEAGDAVTPGGKPWSVKLTDVVVAGMVTASTLRL